MHHTIPLFVICGLAACATVSMPEAPEGQAVYAQSCVQCHGPRGQGDGRWATSMDPPPADLTQLSLNGQFDRARVLSIIDGYDRTGLPGHQMPEFGLLLQGDTVPFDTGDGVLTPTPRPLVALTLYLETLQRE